MHDDDAVDERPAGYWCVVCNRFIPANEYGQIVHDNIDHYGMKFDEEENPQ
jgi:hypothetical protein